MEDYIRAQRQNLDNLKTLPEFAKLVPLLHETYVHSLKLIPLDAKSTFGRLLLLCHKHFLSAATLVGQAQPDDAAAVTRRAIEIAEVAFAIKVDPKNEEKWIAGEKRQSRWQARRTGAIPPRLTIKLSIPHHRILSDLKVFWGVLSDGYVHFTPEFIAGQNWALDQGGEVPEIRLKYFESDKTIIQRELILLSGTHCRILQVFDDCFDRAFRVDTTWHSLMVRMNAEGTKLTQGFRNIPDVAKP